MKDFGSLDAHGALGLGATSWCPIWHLPLEPTAWACVLAPMWCVANPPCGATSELQEI